MRLSVSVKMRVFVFEEREGFETDRGFEIGIYPLFLFFFNVFLKVEFFGLWF